MNSLIKVYNPQGKEIGIINYPIFITERTPEHIMRKFNGAFGLSKRVIQQLVYEGIKHIIFNYRGKNIKQLYKCSLEKFLDSKLTHIFVNNDLQYFVPIKEMETV